MAQPRKLSGLGMDRSEGSVPSGTIERAIHQTRGFSRCLVSK